MSGEQQDHEVQAIAEPVTESTPMVSATDSVIMSDEHGTCIVFYSRVPQGMSQPEPLLFTPQAVVRLSPVAAAQMAQALDNNLSHHASKQLEQ